MTAKIKLNAASGGGSVSLQAPSNTDQNRVISLPVSADGTVLTTTNPKAGNILQVKSVTKTDGFTSTSSTYTDISGLSTTMSLTNSGNKILISYTVTTGSNFWSTGPIFLILLQDSTKIGAGTGGSSADNNSTTLMNFYANDASNSSYGVGQQSTNFLFSPTDTNSHTYKLQTRGQNAQGISINRSWASADLVGTSTLTLMEVAA